MHNEVPKLTGQGNGPASSRFGALRTQANGFGLAVNIIPGQLRDLPFAPACQIGKTDEVLEVRGKIGDHRFDFFGFEKSLPHIPLGKFANVRHSVDPSPGLGESERLA